MNQNRRHAPRGFSCPAAALVVVLLGWFSGKPGLLANPVGGRVAAGAATITSSGSQLTINQTSGSAFINWNSFNIGAGETTTFVQPSSTSVSWNQINDANPSQILGNLNANGYVFLQNANGFYVGGQAAIMAHGVLMTTAAIPAPDLSSSGPWSFTAPPPAAKIVNYGRIQTTDGGSAFLIASDIENNGTISTPGGNIGLYAGAKVLVSMSPDGRGLSAEVTLPAGSVDNQGNLIADAGTIAARAKFVNQDGLIQANSAQNVNGTIELVASDSLNLGAKSAISAQGSSTGTSSGGSVTIKSDNSFSDAAGSTINIGGGAQGGNGGQVSICALQMNSIQSVINGQATTGFVDGVLSIDPYNIVLASSSSDPNAQYSGTVNSGDSPVIGNPPASGTLTLNVNSFAKSLSQINLAAINNITLSTVWNLTDPGVSAMLTLTAGNNITFNTGSAINAGNNWSVNLTAGTALAPGTKPASGSDGIYLNGNAYLQTQNGNINLWAANEVLIATGSGAAVGNNGIRTLNRGNIDVTAVYGSVNTGANPAGFLYQKTAPYNTVSPTVGGISTAAGGNVTINAGQNVTSFNPSGTTVGADAGTGAFGSLPGNVTITAGGSVFGHYVLANANSVGTITAGDTIGAPSGKNSFALSLIGGTWNVNAPNGNIYLQEVRNPNGVFNATGNDSSAGAHLFNYDSSAAVDLTAGIGVYLTGVAIPRLAADPVQVIYPPVLDITAGSGGVTLQTTVTLFPSIVQGRNSTTQGLNITTTAGGSLVSAPNDPGTIPELLMSDSSQAQWTSSATFSDTDHSIKAPLQAGNSGPVVLNISGDMENLTLITTKETKITVGGDMINCGFSGQNLKAADATSITVAGQIFNRSPYSFVYDVVIPNVPASDLLSSMGNSWDNIFTLAVDPTILASITLPANLPASQWAAYVLQSAGLFTVKLQPNGQLLGTNPGFVYDLATGRLGYAGQMGQTVLTDLGPSGQPVTILHLVNGAPVVDSTRGDNSPGRVYGQLETDTVSWAPVSDVQTLFTASSGAPSPINGQLGYRIGGPGEFDITAGSIELGNTYGILSCGVTDPQGGFNRYDNLASLPTPGATLNVKVSGDLSMLTSAIAALGGGDVNVTSTGGSIDLGSQELFNIPRQVGFGIFTSGNFGAVDVTALGDIDINGSRIATFNGGSINVESQQGSVNVGSGGNTANGVYVSFVNSSGEADSYAEQVYGSGIVANTLVDPSQVPGSAKAPGNITVNTPEGDIIATEGGILQIALNGSVSAGPTITLTAGTFPSKNSPGYTGSIDLGNSGVIGGTVNLSANGSISGLVISRQNSTVNAAQNFTGTLLSGGAADVSAGGTVAGTIIGVGGATVSGTVTAQVLGQNVSVNGGASIATLGSSANATSSSQAASQQASQTADQQVASSDNGDDDKKNKKKPLIQKTGRVTVIFSAATPGK